MPPPKTLNSNDVALRTDGQQSTMRVAPRDQCNDRGMHLQFEGPLKLFSLFHVSIISIVYAYLTRRYLLLLPLAFCSLLRASLVAQGQAGYQQVSPWQDRGGLPRAAPHRSARPTRAPPHRARRRPGPSAAPRGEATQTINSAWFRIIKNRPVVLQACICKYHRHGYAASREASFQLFRWFVVFFLT